MLFRSPKYVTEEELDTLIDVCETSLERALVIGLFDSACRISEWLGINIDEIDWEHGLVKVTRKGGSIARVNIPEDLDAEIKKAFITQITKFQK